MSQAGDAAEVRRSSSPGGAVKRKRGLAEYTNSRLSQSSAVKVAKVTDGATASSTSRLHQASSDVKQNRSPDSDEVQHSETGDLLHGLGSASSLNSTASSVFSHGSNAKAHKRPAQGYTPLTSHSDSSPPKTQSPNTGLSSANMSASNGARASLPRPSSDATHKSSQAHNERSSMHLPPGKVKGYRAVWDPDLARGLNKEERKKTAVRVKEFGLEVRDIFHTLLSPYTIQIT